ncbi:MAG: hypothetical protein AAGI08_11160 [Bacteroidota bacterium]
MSSSPTRPASSGHAAGDGRAESVRNVVVIDRVQNGDHASKPRPGLTSTPLPPDHVMDLLAGRYSRFSQLVARGKVEPTDIHTMRSMCRQVRASAEELQREATRRLDIIDLIEQCLDLLHENKERTAEAQAA